MGMSTRLYGCIEEYGNLDEESIKIVYDYNEKIINRLPENDEWPPLSRGMFAITNIENKIFQPNYAYGGRIIHFGANFKSIEYEWKDWKDKFENLLTQLYWTSADVHFKTEYTDVQTFKWRIDLNKWNIDNYHVANKNIESIKKEYWNFEGDSSWEELN